LGSWMLMLGWVIKLIIPRRVKCRERKTPHNQETRKQ
jgi:hypothetical protein